MRAIAIFVSFFGLLSTACDDGSDPTHNQLDIDVELADGGEPQPPNLIINVTNNYYNGDEEVDAGSEPDMGIEDKPTVRQIGEGLCEIRIPYEQLGGFEDQTGTATKVVPCCANDYACRDSEFGHFCAQDSDLARYLGLPSFNTCQPCRQDEWNGGCNQGETCLWGIDQLTPDNLPSDVYVELPYRSVFWCEVLPEEQPICTPSMDDERQGECFDGIDNDCDGAVDYDDAGCFGYCSPSTNCDDQNPLTEDFCSERSWTCQHPPVQFQSTVCGDSRGGVCAQCNDIQVREDQVCVVLSGGNFSSVEAWPDQDHDSIPELDPVDRRQSDAQFDNAINPACEENGAGCGEGFYCGEGFCQPLYNPETQFLIEWRWDDSFSMQCLNDQPACTEIPLDVPEDLVFSRFVTTCVDEEGQPILEGPITYLNMLPNVNTNNGIIITRDSDAAGCFVSLVGYCGEYGEECWHATQLLNDPETSTPNGMRQFGQLRFEINDHMVASGTARLDYPTNFTVAWWIPLPANN